MIPSADGMWEDAQYDGMVISHDCEYTKIAKNGGYLLIAPVRPISEWEEPEVIRRGKVFSLMALPRETPVEDDEYVVDFRFIQPMHLRQLLNAERWCSSSPETADELRGRLQNFLFRGMLA